MPPERRRKTKTTDDIPSSGDPERKRVLNILAQRRYRTYAAFILFPHSEQIEVVNNVIGHRQREKIAALEAQATIKELPERLNQDQEVSHFEGRSELVSRIRSTSPPNVATGEMVRSSDGFDIPEIDFRRESLDMSPLHYFGE
jgi:hypothetical protein